MNKWGVRLVGCIFFVWAISDTLKLILTGRTGGFFGIHFYLFTYNGVGQIDILGWIGIYILFYTGIQLMRFDNRARIWALIMLWPYTIFLGALFIAALVSFFSPLVREHLSSSITWNWIAWPKPEPPLGLSLFFGVLFIYFLTPLYFLLRKSTKQLFIKPLPTDGNT